MNTTNEQIKITIAEACGWTRIPAENVGTTARLFYGDIWWRDDENNTIASADQLPDYLNDLNAMHEAEKMLTEEQFSKYVWTLLGDGKIECREFLAATARQRAEAFIKTLNLESK